MKSILLGFSMHKSNQLICYGGSDSAKQTGRFKSDAQITKAKESSAERIASQISENRAARDAQIEATKQAVGKAAGFLGRLAGKAAVATWKVALSVGKAAVRTAGNEIKKEVARRSSPSAAEKKAKQAEINRAMR